jgi:hypothetical protein
MRPAIALATRRLRENFTINLLTGYQLSSEQRLIDSSIA